MQSISEIFIVVPSASTASPVKGAVALANALAKHVKVTFVPLKQPEDSARFLSNHVLYFPLSNHASWKQKLSEYRKLLNKAGRKHTVISISYCLSADMINVLCRDDAVTCSSVRGNLVKVYPETYGFFGKFLSRFHLRMLSKLDYVVSMSDSMSNQVQKYIGKRSPVIGNFIDESSLEAYRRPKYNSGPLRFIFTGSLLPAKQPDLLIDAVAKLQSQGIDARLDIYGDGPLASKLSARAARVTFPGTVIFHGYVPEPYADISRADAFVLPSLTEGISRSALEALFLGVPCVLRDVDGNSELIKPGFNGNLFSDDEALPEVMYKTALLSRQNKLNDDCLLLEGFRQNRAAEKYLALLQGQ